MAEGGGNPAATSWKATTLAGLVGIGIGVGLMLAFNGYFVRSYLLSNPEVLIEAMEVHRSREMARSVGTNRAAIETPFHSAWAGAADADVVLVEFFDYACGFCRASNSAIARLLREDNRLKVVWREYPVLGPNSEQAAIASLAAARAGRFRPFYDRLFASGPPSPENLAATNAALRLQPAQLTDEYRGEIQRNYELARSIGASGTPVFVVGDQVFHGAVGYEALRDAIRQARAARS